MSPEDKQRRLLAKRNNERVKLAAGFLNTLGLTILGATFVLPSVTGGRLEWIWIPVGIVLHLVAQALVRLLRSED
jgi:hypothetical protein